MAKLTEIVYLIFIGSVKGSSASNGGKSIWIFVYMFFMYYELNRSHGRNWGGI